MNVAVMVVEIEACRKALAPEALRLLEQMLGDQDEFVRSVVAEELGSVA